MRIPLAVRWPGRIPAGRVVDDFVSHLDFAPTFLDVAGIAVPALITGRSLLPVLTSRAAGRVDPTRDAAYPGLERHTWCRPDGGTYPMRAVHTADFLDLRNFVPDRWPTGGPAFVSSLNTFHGDVDGAPIQDCLEDPANQRRFPTPFALCYGKRPPKERYDVRAHPNRIHNLATNPAYRATREKLWQQLDPDLAQTGDPRIAGRDPSQAYLYRQTGGFGASLKRT